MSESKWNETKKRLEARLDVDNDDYKIAAQFSSGWVWGYLFAFGYKNITWETPAYLLFLFVVNWIVFVAITIAIRKLKPLFKKDSADESSGQD